MNVTNYTDTAIQLTLGDVVCMFDGSEGSNLSYFNKAIINPGQTLPGGLGQYIEAKASGSCGSKVSTFSLSAEGTNGNSLGTILVSEVSNAYKAVAPKGSYFNSEITPGDQAHIDIWVGQAPPPPDK